MSNSATLGIIACQAALSMGFSRQESGVSCNTFIQRIFPTQESNLRLLQLLHCRQILYQWATGETLHTYINLCIKLDNFLSNNRKLLTNLGKWRIIICIFKKLLIYSKNYSYIQKITHIFKWKATDTGSGKTMWCSSGDLDVQIKAQSYQYSSIRTNQLQSLLVLSSMHNV